MAPVVSEGILSAEQDSGGSNSLTIEQNTQITTITKSQWGTRAKENTTVLLQELSLY